MANEQNLIPGNLTAEEASRIGKLGGIASGEARRERRRLRDYMEYVLSLPVSDKRKFNKLARMGIELENIDNKMLLVVSLADKAYTGDVAAAKEIRSIIGEDVHIPPGSDGEDDGLFDAIAEAVLNREV